ncbi:proton-conducting transporter membrane subunit [Thiohalorhabdus sp. Cl-TMA]|uniref:Proton-conducting transporter membrane subunit n=1 Tax=Thiohalorhabdus methylotrophus TaxID=3242694 RepID=A0ABV4TRC3_9GAMM
MAPLTALPASWGEPLLLGAWLAPLLGLLLLALPRGRGPGMGWAPLWGLPALAAGLLVADGTAVQWPWMLTGTRFAMDPVGRVFLLLAAILWTAAAGFSRGYLGADAGRKAYPGFFLAAMAGNLGLTVAQDPVSFLAFFTLMGLPAYGLVVHSGTPFARHAANVYLGATAGGEVLVLAGLLLMAGGGGTTAGALLLIAGLGSKAGLVPLHFWLPLAHPAAPAPASAVLSGTMIKAGLLGWIRFLPLGEAAFPELGRVLIALGLAGAFLAVAVGLPQRDPKTVLAYSSISQMGWLAAAVGAGMAAPAAWSGLLPAVLAYAFHHGLAKGALFLSTAVTGERAGGRFGRVLLWTAVVLPALAIAGLPGTSGGAAKKGLKEALTHTPGLAAWDFATLLTAGAAATTLLMVRFLVVLRGGGAGRGLDARALAWWGAVVAASLLLPWLWPRLSYWNLKTLSAAELVDGLQPVVAAALLGLAWAWAAKRFRLPGIPPIPAGDLYAGLEAGTRWLGKRTTGLWQPLGALWRPYNRIWVAVYTHLWLPSRQRLTAADRWGWGTSGAAFLLILAALAWALFPPGAGS